MSRIKFKNKKSSLPRLDFLFALDTGFVWDDDGEPDPPIFEPAPTHLSIDFPGLLLFAFGNISRMKWTLSIFIQTSKGPSPTPRCAGKVIDTSFAFLVQNNRRARGLNRLGNLVALLFGDPDANIVQCHNATGLCGRPLALLP